MAKGMNKGNREAKKPKKDKSAVKAPPSPLTAALREAQARSEAKQGGPAKK